MAHQHFGKSSDPDADKQAFMNDLPTRRVTDGLLVLCGETNIASTHRRSDDFSDPHGFTDRLGEMNVGPILNPIHGYMTRYEMWKKRRHYSLGGRTVISVWNQGRRKGGPSSTTAWSGQRPFGNCPGRLATGPIFGSAYSIWHRCNC